MPAQRTDSLEAWAAAHCEALESKHLSRCLQETALVGGVRVRRGEKELINFSGNDYLGFSQHPLVHQAAVEALTRYGAGAGASRLVTGNHPGYAPLEHKLAHMKGFEAALVFGSGYLANMGIVSTLMGRQDVIIADKLVHACIVDGARVSGASFLRFHHNDMEHLEQLLVQHRKLHKRCLVVTDAVFSMDGDRAPMQKLRELCDAHDAWLMADDAHGFGVCGPEQAEEVKLADVLMGTLSKAVGCYGGYVCASRAVVDAITASARTLLFSTGLPPMAVTAALRALELMELNPEWCLRPLGYAKQFAAWLGLPPAQSPIVPVIFGETLRTMEASRALEAEGCLVTAIRPPTVPEGTARLRVTFSALHEKDQCDRLAFLIHSWRQKRAA